MNTSHIDVMRFEEYVIFLPSSTSKFVTCTNVTLSIEPTDSIHFHGHSYGTSIRNSDCGIIQPTNCFVQIEK